MLNSPVVLSSSGAIRPFGSLMQGLILDFSRSCFTAKNLIILGNHQGVELKYEPQDVAAAILDSEPYILKKKRKLPQINTGATRTQIGKSNRSEGIRKRRLECAYYFY